MRSFNSAMRRRFAIPAALLLLTSCATVHHVVPPEDYHDLHWPNTYHVKTKDGQLERVASAIETPDSALVITRPSYPLQDRRHYPVSIPNDQIASIETQKQESLLFVELGAVTGKNFGVESDSYERNRVIFEFGYLSDQRVKVDPPRWNRGLTLYLGAGDSESRIGLKARVRYHVNSTISFDAGAGPLFKWWDNQFINGFVGGVGVSITRYISLRSEYMSFGVDEWKDGSGPNTITHPSGLEQVWYNGATFSGTPAWWIMGIAGVAMVALFVAIAVSPPQIGY